MTYKPIGIRNYYIDEWGHILNKDNGKILKPFKNRNGYLRVELKISPGVPKKFYIHRLVYQVFIGKLESDKVIEHLDGNQINNHYTNLRQSTQSTNIQTAIKHNTFGENNRKFIIIRDKNTGEILEFNKIKDLIIFLGLSIPNGALSKLKRHSRFKNNYEIVSVK